MKLAVLGKSGQLGAELMARAPAMDFEAVGFGSDVLDVTSRESFEATVGVAQPDVVVNTTAFHVVPDCDRLPHRAFAVNAAAVKTMAEICHERGLGLVTYSTDYVFDGRKGQPYLEDDRPNPLQTYGVSKYAGEILSTLFHPGSLVLRTCAVYGGASGSRSKKGNFVLTMLRESESKRELEVSAEQIVSPTYASDLAAATLALIACRPHGGIYHLAADGHCSWAEFATAIMELSGRPMRIIPVDRGGQSGALRRPLFSALANTRAKALGIVLPHWKEGLQRYLSRLEVSARP